MDRVHRIGQTRPVRAIRFIMQNSIEERFINVQDAKQCLGKGSMERLKKEDRSKANVRKYQTKTNQHTLDSNFVRALNKSRRSPCLFSLLYRIALYCFILFSTDYRYEGSF